MDVMLTLVNNPCPYHISKNCAYSVGVWGTDP